MRRTCFRIYKRWISSSLITPGLGIHVSDCLVPGCFRASPSGEDVFIACQSALSCIWSTLISSSLVASCLFVQWLVCHVPTQQDEQSFRQERNGSRSECRLGNSLSGMRVAKSYTNEDYEMNNLTQLMSTSKQAGKKLIAAWPIYFRTQFSRQFAQCGSPEFGAYTPIMVSSIWI